MSKVMTLFGIVVLSSAVAHPEEPDLTSAIRGVLETSLQDNLGIGFTSFECDTGPPLGAGDRLVCSAVDEEGDALRYTIEVDEEGGAGIIRAEQRAASLPPEDLEILEPPCRTFLDAYRRSDWPGLFAELHPALQEVLGNAARVEGMLVPVREFFGDVRTVEPEWFSVMPDGANEMEYGLGCEAGRAQARFEIAPDDKGDPRLLAFIVTAFSGSEEQARMLEREARQALGPVIGFGIERVDAPFERLVRRGDVVHGTAVLDDGRELPVRIEQHGVRDDYEVNDWRFAVIDAEFLMERALRPKLGNLETVRCDAGVVPDGGETTCLATLEGGETREFVLRRDGGDHRLFPAE